ncbi:MAG: hypothetical protein ACKVOM_00260, partial [Ferruginibacter sp.]
MAYFKRILNNCVEASLLALREKEEKITLKQKFEMKFHIFFCKCCKNFAKQSSQMDQYLKAYFEGMNNKHLVQASADFKARMKKQ